MTKGTNTATTVGTHALNFREENSLLKESENMERALGIRSEMERRQKYWDLDAAKHIHDNLCQMGKVCYYVSEKRPVVRELDDIMAAIKAEV